MLFEHPIQTPARRSALCQCSARHHAVQNMQPPHVKLLSGGTPLASMSLANLPNCVSRKGSSSHTLSRTSRAPLLTAPGLETTSARLLLPLHPLQGLLVLLACLASALLILAVLLALAAAFLPLGFASTEPLPLRCPLSVVELSLQQCLLREINFFVSIQKRGAPP